MEFVLFAGQCYYPMGGMDDIVFKGSMVECRDYFKAHYIKEEGYVDVWGQIVDPATFRIVESIFICEYHVERGVKIIWKVHNEENQE